MSAVGQVIRQCSVSGTRVFEAAARYFGKEPEPGAFERAVDTKQFPPFVEDYCIRFLNGKIVSGNDVLFQRRNCRR